MTTDADRERARAWLSDTPYLSMHPGVPSNLPMTIATPEKIASLADLLAACREEAERLAWDAAQLKGWDSSQYRYATFEDWKQGT